MAVELKYPTRKLITEVNGEEYHLANGVADLTLCDYIKDMEQITSQNAHTLGYARALFPFADLRTMQLDLSDIRPLSHPPIDAILIGDPV